LKAGTIAGIVIGSLAALMVPISACFILRKRQRVQKRFATTPDPFLKESVESSAGRDSDILSDAYAYDQKRPFPPVGLQNLLPLSSKERRTNPLPDSTSPTDSTNTPSDTAQLRDVLINLRREMDEIRAQRVYEMAPPPGYT